MLSVISLIDNRVKELRLNVDSAENSLRRAKFIQLPLWHWLTRFVVPTDRHENSGIGGKIFHQR